MPKDLTALEELLTIIEDETGVNGICADEPDDGSVGWLEDGPMPMTFGHVRRARAALDAMKST
ncbi:hypothetical protein [Phaeobacter inhibens]|uniref:hypothetical protein n=1 Tax=Phaeobacter inhibens TaxID=221822 RepID=UPI000C99DE8C|nr:hypothetical protein [Phaeobacter inhibens]AUQ71059.1 hypothetical protein PhaeoP54_02180 [Phaeobacter inhibens]